MKKAFTIYIDDDTELITIHGAFVTRLANSEITSINYVSESVEGYNAVYLPFQNTAVDESPLKLYKEGEE